jgi:hypothetical protein
MVTAQPWPAGASSSASRRRERNPLGVPLFSTFADPPPGGSWFIWILSSLIRFEKRLLGSMQSVWCDFTCKRAAGLLVALRCRDAEPIRLFRWPPPLPPES